MRKLYFVNGFSMFCASQLYVSLLRYLPRFPPKVVTVTEVTVFSGGGIRDFENFQIVSNNNR